MRRVFGVEVMFTPREIATGKDCGHGRMTKQGPTNGALDLELRCVIISREVYIAKGTHRSR